MPRRLRQIEDPWHWEFWPSDAGAAQTKQDTLCHENIGQTKGFKFLAIFSWEPRTGSKTDHVTGTLS